MDLFKKAKGLKLVGFLKKFGFYPFLRELEGTNGNTVQFEGRELIMLGSNNYLGLTHNQRVMDAAKDAIDKWGTGCTGSRFLNGNLQLHAELEQKLASFLGFESALIFATGFMTNQGVLESITGEGEYIFSDEDNHACIIEGCKLSKAKTIVYKHHDMKDLEEKLKSVPKSAGKLIVTDGVFSMNGSIAKFDQIQYLANKYNARTYLDEAHALGTIGLGGRGTSSHHRVKPDLLMGTFSKTFASQGGFVCGPRDVIDWIKHKSKTFMFSAALSPANTAAAFESLNILVEQPELVEEVRKKSLYLKKGFEALGFDTMNSETCIVPVFIGDDKKALKISNDLLKHNVFVTPVVYPAVADGQALIRCSVMATHTYEELDRAIEAFAQFQKSINGARGKVVALHKLLNQDLEIEEISQISDIGEASL